MSFTIAHEILLVVRDGEGRIRANKTLLAAGLAGGVLCELGAAQRITTENRRITVVDPTPIGHPAADRLLADLDLLPPKRPSAVIGWNKHLRDPLLDELVDAGVLRRQQDRLLRLIPDLKHPTVDPEPEQEVRARLAHALTDPRAASARTAGLARIVAAIGAVKWAFPSVSPLTRAGQLRKLRQRPVHDSVERVLRDLSGATAAAVVALGGMD